MYASRIRAAGLAVAATLGLSACMSPYGYSGVGVGIGSGGYYGDYGYGGYGYPYGGYGSYGYGYPAYGGWYDDFYYPGTGYYVYSRDGHRHRWTDAQRRYWESRRDRKARRAARVSESSSAPHLPLIAGGYAPPRASSAQLGGPGRRAYHRGDRRPMSTPREGVCGESWSC